MQYTCFENGQTKTYLITHNNANCMLSHIRKYLSQNKENPTPFQNIIRMLPNPNLHCVLCFDVITKVVTYFITHKNDLGFNAA